MKRKKDYTTENVELLQKQVEEYRKKFKYQYDEIKRLKDEYEEYKFFHEYLVSIEPFPSIFTTYDIANEAPHKVPNIKKIENDLSIISKIKYQYRVWSLESVEWTLTEEEKIIKNFLKEYFENGKETYS